MNCPFCEASSAIVAGRAARISELENHRPRLIDYLKLKYEAEDWHGCMDAAVDLRDLDSELDGLRW